MLALAAARFGDALGNSILFVIIPLYVASLPSPWLPVPDSLRAGLLIAIYGLVTAGLQPMTGAWIDWSARYKPFILWGLILASLATLGFVLASQFGDLVLLRVVQAVGLSATVPAGMALLAASSERNTRGGSMGIYTTARMIGFSMGPLIGGALFDTVGFNPAFYTAAGFIALAALLVHLWVAEPTEKRPRHNRDGFRLFDGSLLTPGILGASLAVFAMAAAFSMMAPLEKQFNERLGQGAFAFGIAFSVMMVSRTLLQLPFGRLSDRFGRKWVIISGLAIMAPATWLMGEVETTMQLVAARIVQGIGSAGIAAPAFALAADAASGDGRGRQMAVTTMGFGLGIAAGPLIAGGLAIISFRLPFMVGAVMLTAAAWVIYRFVPEPAIPRTAKVE